MLITKTLKVSPRGGTYKRYRQLGYEFELGDTIEIKVDELPRYSPTVVECSCDYCGIHLNVRYADYMRSMEKPIKKYSCVHCRGKQNKESNRIIYGVDNVMQVQEYKDKLEQTNIERFGVRCNLLTEENKEKVKATNRERYGVENCLSSADIVEKRKKTLIQRYGVDVPLKNASIKEKTKRTFVEKYGVDNPQKNKDIRCKTVETMFKGNKVYTSKQQKYLHKLYGGTINYPISSYNVDILTPDFLVVEYDGGGHALQVKFGQSTEKEFDHKEVVREQQIRRAGYKIMRIASSKDRLPFDDVLLKMIEDARNYFFDYPQHSWIQFDIDKGIIRNAENQEGVPYLFGELRQIKKEDIA